MTNKILRILVFLAVIGAIGYGAAWWSGNLWLTPIYATAVGLIVLEFQQRPHLIQGMFRKPAKQPEGLISVLLDPNAQCGDRDDAALDLQEFQDPRAEAALVKVASDPDTDDELADTCGHSLGVIWTREGRVDLNALDGLHPVAKDIAAACIRSERPDLLPSG